MQPDQHHKGLRAGPSLNELAVVAGVGRAITRAALSAQVVEATNLTWLDALTLRIFSTVSPARLPGESVRASERLSNARAALATEAVREAVASNEGGGDVQLVITRQEVRLQESLVHVMTYLSQEMSGQETALVLPVGRWWADMHWRLETTLDAPS